VIRQAEDAWIRLLVSGPAPTWPSPGCTPGYYNYEGQDPGSWGRLRVGYPWGPRAFFSYIGRRRRSGTFDGLAFR
jgi:cyclohexanone monooxygenase